MIIPVQGDITRTSGDALVNAANGMGTMGGGVAGAIRRAGGRVIQDEAIVQARILREEVARERASNPRARVEGRVYVTGAGSLPFRHVFHAVTMLEPAGPTSYDIVAECLDSILAKTRELGYRTVVLPALGTGVGGLDPLRVAELYLAKLEPASETFRVVDIAEAFIRHLQEALGRGPDGAPSL